MTTENRNVPEDVCDRAMAGAFMAKQEDADGGRQKQRLSCLT